MTNTVTEVILNGINYKNIAFAISTFLITSCICELASQILISGHIYLSKKGRKTHKTKLLEVILR
jgi:hypothetical protein